MSPSGALPPGRGGSDTFPEIPHVRATQNRHAGNGPGGVPFSQEDGGGRSTGGPLPVVLRMSGVPAALLTYDNILSFCSMVRPPDSSSLQGAP